MPVILARDREAAWLDAATPRPSSGDILAGLPAARIALRPVGTAVNDARYDGPECLEAPLPSPQASCSEPARR